MKVQATVVLSFQAKTLTDAGALLDDVLARAHGRDDVDVASIDFTTPPGDRLVTVPRITSSGPTTPGVPFTSSVYVES